MESPQDDGLTARFNRLSFGNRTALRMAAVSQTVSGMIRDDTKKHPWLYPFYMTYLVCLVTPLPFPGFSTILAAATVAYASLPFLPGTKKLHERFAEAMKRDNMMTGYAEFIEPHAKKPDSENVRGGDLTRHVMKTGLNDVKLATHHALDGVRKIWNPPFHAV